jgi:hypothetical protein
MTYFSTMTRTAAAAATVFALSAFGATAEDAKVEQGTLKCDVEGGVGMILGSSKDMTCVFTHKDGTTEDYTGRVLKIGVDIGVTEESHITWAVFARTKQIEPGALSGNYTGVSAEATLAGGVGASILVGGKDSFTLQPVSVQTQTGLNIAGGIGSIRLEYQPPAESSTDS